MAKHFVQQFKKHFFVNKLPLNRFSSSVKDVTKSSLFISGQRAEDTFVVVVPHLDFDARFANMPLLEENIKRRRLDCNLNEMKESWDFYKEWNEKKVQLQENINEAGKRMIELSRKEDSEEKKAELEKLERYKVLVREELTQVKKNIWNMEDNIICKLLKLPNALHPETPEKEEELFVFDKENVEGGFNHLQIGLKLNCLEYQNELTFFLKNKAALFELAVPELFVDKFARQGFIRFSNPDFTRSVLAEGVGLSPNQSDEVFLLENTEGNNDHLHLCGGASLFPFCGFHAKQSVPKHSLPVRYIATGRRYSPTPATSLPGLYSVNQSTSVQLFTANFSEAELYQEFQSCVENIRDIFSSLGLKFKIVKQPPAFLKTWESLRASIEVYSPYNKVFVEVGNISVVDDFVSKRLRMCYLDKNKEQFLKVLCGTVVNTQTLLALCLERSNSDLFIPDIVKDYMIR